ncbi:hypothetical protein B4589_014785 [Halolamina sp. CBA1230]|uniref:hypothetical protein n=1 Tax=Halolamina sp. CBA1230 TaxID=1853690 RepID=UPI0009A211D6|nr:hypothetical protein [Halolamina sp. CBA1230]QKY21578.1 hypothetical protein B4589_014785 [Halolamina sp. CBA1230]
MDRLAAARGSVVAAVVATGVVLGELPTPVTSLALVGPFIAGAVSDPVKFDGAAEGAVAAGVAVPLTMIAVGVARYLTFQGTDSALQLLWLTGGPQAVGAVFVGFPLALAVGALAGWLGRLVRDLATGDISIAGF